jgi:hypothetical protein
MLVVVMVGCCLLVVSGCKGAAPQATTPTAAPPAAQPHAKPAAAQPRAGQKTPVVIEAYYPLTEGHKFIADYLKSVEAANPGKVRVAIYDMQTEEGRKKWQGSGLSCAGVFVNGSTHQEITRNGKKEGVDFLQRMDVFWSHDDFETVVRQILQKNKQTFVSPNYKPKAAATEGAAGAKPAATPKAKPSGSKG